MKTVIFTDLDGSLLHARTYSFKDALPALRLIQERRVPLILCSSKTRAEIEVYRERLNNRDPFISENGGGIFIPAGYFSVPVGGGLLNDYTRISLGTPYHEIRRHVVNLRERMKVQVKGFGDMSVEEIARLTGLGRGEAALAKEREFDEPIVFPGDADEEFLAAVEKAGLRWTRGRFFHILGNSDKGKAVKILKRYYESEYGRIMTMGLGDGFNDLPLLREVDHPVLIPREEGGYDPRVDFPQLTKAKKSGPAGWNEAVLGLLEP